MGITRLVLFLSVLVPLGGGCLVVRGRHRHYHYRHHRRYQRHHRCRGHWCRHRRHGDVRDGLRGNRTVRWPAVSAPVPRWVSV